MMKYFIGWILILSAPALARSPSTETHSGPGSADQSGTVAQARLTVTVRVFNYAQVPPAELDKAKRRIVGLFQKAGLGIRWIDCMAPGAAMPSPGVCDHRSGPIPLVVNLLPRSMSERSPLPKNRFGYAVMARDGGPSLTSTVFYDRIEVAARRGGYTPSAILSIAIAHEMGHLLLGEGSHSRGGLMQAVWKDAQLHEAQQGHLRFTRKQSRRIRAEVLHRAGKADARGKSLITQGRSVASDGRS